MARDGGVGVGVPVTNSASHRRQRLGPGQRRDQLMTATVEVLAAHGYRGATAGAIVAQAGMSKGLLWHYFADLDELMEHTARWALRGLANAAAAHLDLAAPAPEVVRAAIHRATKLPDTQKVEFSALKEIVVNLRTPDGAQRLSLDDYEELYAAQEGIFRRGQDEGDFRASLDPRLLAVTYQGAVDAMLGYLETHPDIDPDQYATIVADVLLHGACRER